MSDQSKTGMSRRTLIKGGIAATVLGGVAFARPSDQGEPGHGEYFQRLSDTLKHNNIGKPSLVVDKTLMANNIETLSRHLQGRFDYRIVAKSLPSIEMLKWTMAKASTKKLMVFHQPFLNAVAKEIPQADVLMGKPMPIAAVKTFYNDLKKTSSEFHPEQQLQWLVDSPARLKQYKTFAQSQDVLLNINIELDVGLHRGGVSTDADLVEMLSLIEQSSKLTLSGFMGYEPHIGKVPGDPLSQRDAAMALYAHYLSLAEKTLQRSLKGLTLNAAGSPTYQYYNDQPADHWPMNELSSGSCLVKPSDFDLPTLEDHQAAAYIASPVLKVLEQTEIPGVSFLGDAMALWNQNWQKTFFAYGGYWKANPVSPKGLTLNPVYGRSSNQEMYNGSRTIQLQQDDYIFLRPTQSESVLLQFGDILVIENGVLTDRWPVIQA